MYKAWVAPKSNTESGTQEVIHNDSDVKYRFESCPDYKLNKNKQNDTFFKESKKSNYCRM